MSAPFLMFAETDHLVAAAGMSNYKFFGNSVKIILTTAQSGSGGGWGRAGSKDRSVVVGSCDLFIPVHHFLSDLAPFRVTREEE
jgi:hypothetical protein